MIELTGKEVDKYDKISKEISSIATELESKKQEIQTMIGALSIMQDEIDESLKHLHELGTATEKEVLRLESLTINDDSMMDAVPAQEEPIAEEAAEVAQKDTQKEPEKPVEEKKAPTEESEPATEQEKKSKKSKVNEAQQTLLPEEPTSENAN